MVTFATKSVFITVFAMQCNLVFSLHSHEVVMTKDLTHVLNRKTATYNFKQEMTNEYLITGPLAEQLRAKFGFLFSKNKPREPNDDLETLRRRFKFLFKSVNVPKDQLDLLEGTRQQYNQKYAARIARLSRYFLKPTIYFD